MSLPAALLLFELCFVCIRPILTNLFPVEQFCPLNTGFNSSLTALDVRYNDLGEGSAVLAEAVSKSQQIETFCEVPVKQMRDDALTELDLKDKNIGACGAMVVAHLLEFSRSLKSANLAASDIGDEGASAISTALESNTTLTDLNLQAHFYATNIVKISDTGAQAIAKMLAVNRALNSVDLRNNFIPDEGKQQLRDAVGDKSITLKL